VLLGHILNPEIAVFCQKKHNNSVFKKTWSYIGIFCNYIQITASKKGKSGFIQGFVGIRNAHVGFKP